MSKISLSFGEGGASGSDDVTASSAEVLKGYTAITTDSDDEPIEGTIESEEGKTIYASTSDQIVIPADKYTLGDIVLKGLSQSGLSSDNILRGRSISISNGLEDVFNVTGNYPKYRQISGSIHANKYLGYYDELNVHYTNINPGLTPVFAAYINGRGALIRHGPRTGNPIGYSKGAKWFGDYNLGDWSANSCSILCIGSDGSDDYWVQYWIWGY